MGAFGRPRRSCLAVPGSNVRMLDKAHGLPADQVFLDLEDAVAPPAKAAARGNVVAALNEGDWAGKILAVRVNDPTTAWAIRDVVDVVEGAGSTLDCVVLPKVSTPEHVAWLDLTLGQLERGLGLPVGGIGIEAQIETAGGVSHVEAIAASPRLETIILGPADLMASLNMRSLSVGTLPADYPGDPLHYVLMRLLVAARTHQLQAIDGPFLQVHDLAGFRAAASRAAVLGFDGTWVVHPGQIATANEIFSPTQAEYDRAEEILDAYARATSAAGGSVGAVMFGDEMIDEASRKMALVVAGKGRAAGLRRTG
jgi:citrate lyase subunit beta / citryl-CoA lyase